MLTASESQKTRTLSEQEIEQLFVDHYDLLYAAAKSVAANKHDAEDIVQTLFLKFVGQKFWPEITTNFKGYLYRVAVNESARHDPLTEPSEGNRYRRGVCLSG